MIKTQIKMRKFIFFVVLAGFVSTAMADEPEKNAPVVKTTAQIEGKVIDHITGEALVGVSLLLSGSDVKTYSDLDGNFKFDGIATGTYDIEIDYVSYKDVTLKQVTTESSDVKLKVQLEPESQMFMP
jgi:hypothetical protein